MRILLISAALLACFAPAKADPFSGGYVGITGGYDFSRSDPTTINLSDLIYHYVPDYDYAYPYVPQDSVSGAKIGFLAGYNATSGPFLIGFEARGQYNFGKSSGATTNVMEGASLPFTISSTTCYGCSSDFLDNYPINAYPFQLSNSMAFGLEVSRPWQIDFSIKAGMFHEGWLMFAKFGAGIEETKTVWTADYSQTVTCNVPVAERQRPSSNTVNIVVTGCDGTSPGAVSTHVFREIDPIAIFGAGAERNFGSYFARAEAELIAHLHNGYSYYTPAVNIALGYRF